MIASAFASLAAGCLVILLEIIMAVLPGDAKKTTLLAAARPGCPSNRFKPRQKVMAYLQRPVYKWGRDGFASTNCGGLAL